MRKTLLLLVIGMAVGYTIGFSDGRTHEDDIVHRVVARVGGSTRSHMPNDVDATMDRLEKK